MFSGEEERETLVHSRNEMQCSSLIEGSQWRNHRVEKERERANKLACEKWTLLAETGIQGQVQLILKQKYNY